ncbi:hypothetical protein [Dictyobacter formicarum]|uniref:DUF2157 domain-containing protein n=1 Tax=Dictyobacter formicarum TaxID=2778368 RepID=A0ABQ3VIQ9_9CHLR|nr:hypothetical protein [Dictyobacter formicarum]GHO86027.1 hypothetical protein KSZ_40330 [Dictyobacter formicarum]
MTDTNMQYSTHSDIISQQQENASSTQVVIWTPPFIVFFASLLGFGLGIASLITFIWLNSGLYSIERVAMIYSVVLIVAWLIVLLTAHSWWVRGGALFGLIWAACTFGEFWLSKHGVGSQDPLTIQMRAATNSALLACALCISVARIRLKLWDAALLWLLLLALCAYLGYSYLKVPAGSNSLLFIEGRIVSWALYLSVAVWWLRPSCWRDQPGLTFLLGLAAILLFFLNRSSTLNTEQNVFFLQVFFLCLLLGAVRVFQGEWRIHRQRSSSQPLAVKNKRQHSL